MLSQIWLAAYLNPASPPLLMLASARAFLSLGNQPSQHILPRLLRRIPTLGIRWSLISDMLSRRDVAGSRSA